MAENSSAEKTEDPTERKLSKSREDGQVARSPELPAAAVTIGAILDETNGRGICVWL